MAIANLPSPDDDSIPGIDSTPDHDSSPEADLSPDTHLPGDAPDALLLPFPSSRSTEPTPTPDLQHPQEVSGSDASSSGVSGGGVSSVAGDSRPDLTAPPGLELAALLTSLNPQLCTGKDVLDGIAGFGRIISWATAHQQKWLSVAGTTGAVVEKDDAIAMVEARDGVDFDILSLKNPGSAAERLQEQTDYLAAQELAPLLTLAAITTKQRISAARDVVTNLPMIHEALLTGTLNPYRASMIAKGTATLSRETRQLATQILLNQGAELGNTRLQKLIDRTVADLDRDAYNELGIQAAKNRGFGMTAYEHGMARVWADLPADQAVLIKGIVDELAEHHFKRQEQPANPTEATDRWRSMSQLRADVFADIILTLATTGLVDLRPLLHDGAPSASEADRAATANADRDSDASSGPSTDTGSDFNAAPGSDSNAAPSTDTGSDFNTGPDFNESDSDTDTDTDTQDPDATEYQPNPLIRPTSLNLTMSVETLLQIRNDPGYLEGFSFVPDYLRDGIAKSVASVSVLVLDNCGTLLDLGKTARFPRKALTRYLQARDVYCRCPGCNNSARRSDLDHQQPWKPPPNRTDKPKSCGRGREREPEPYGRKPENSNFLGPKIRDGAADLCETHCSTDHLDGETCPGNMAALSRTHHLMKHHTRWEVQHCADHSLVWTTPNGHQHTTYPHDWRMALPTEWISVAAQQLRDRQFKEAAGQRKLEEAAARYPDNPPF